MEESMLHTITIHTHTISFPIEVHPNMTFKEYEERVLQEAAKKIVEAVLKGHCTYQVGVEQEIWSER